MNKRILIVEDDSSLTRLLRDNLVYEGFAVECASNGRDALRQAKLMRPDLVLLDLMLPELDGFEVCRSLNADGRVPIIMLTARTREQDKVRGLDLGADDYVTKPFSLNELLARMHAVLRRSQRNVNTLTLGNVLIDFARMRAEKAHVPLELTAREFTLLQYLAEHPGKVVGREELLQAVWGYNDGPMTRTVDTFVARLRRKIEPDPHHPRFIRTMHGDGYSLTAGS
jgi:DNA-binding response OmpR family regulator